MADMRLVLLFLVGALPPASCDSHALVLVQTGAKVQAQAQLSEKYSFLNRLRQTFLFREEGQQRKANEQADSEGATKVSLLSKDQWRGKRSQKPNRKTPKSQALAKAEVTGQTAVLSENGYQAVAELQSVEQMKAYMQRVIDDMNLTVLNDGALSAVARWYDGECALQSLDRMRAELHESTFANKCHDPWLKNKDLDHEADPYGKEREEHPHGWNMHLDEELPPLATPAEFKEAKYNNTKMRQLIDHIVRRKGGMIVDAKNGQQLRAFIAIWRNQPKDKDLAGLLKSVDDASQMPDSFIKIGGQYASLDDDGYQAIATRHERGEMNLFVRRVIKDQGLHLAAGGVGVGGLNGMLPYYNGMCAVQSYENLVAELNAVPEKSPACGGGWLKAGYEA